MEIWEVMLAHYQIYRSFLASMEHDLQRQNLDAKEFMLLRVLEDYKNPADIARRLMLPKPTVTFLIKRLEVKRYVKRRGDAGDLRKFEIEATDKGLRAYHAARAIMTAAFELKLAKISPAELRAYIAVLEKLR